MPAAVPVDSTAAGPDHPGLIPASLLELDRRDHEPLRPIRRSGRDWTVDVICVVLSAAVGAAFLASTATDPPTPSAFALAVDGVFGAISCAALWLRRRFPVGVAVLTALLSIFSVATAVAATIAMFTAAVHRRPQTALVIGLLNVATAGLFFLIRPHNLRINGEPVPWWILMVITTAMLGAVVAWGMLVRARRQLVVSLHERARRAEAEQRLLADQARQAERARIAREMHDVVAHRVSLITLHAGALQIRPDLPPAEIERTAALIRTAARQALEELRGVIGVLHDDGSTEASSPAPQPTVADIARLVEDSRRAGASIELRMDVDDPTTAPGGLGRDAYRIVQEAFTNINKHAPGTATEVTVSGAPGRGLQVTVCNRLPLTAASGPPAPGSGRGLVGLTERAALSGGTLHHGPTTDGHFLVRADLKWSR
jgi:signal transduction histidine kinase